MAAGGVLVAGGLDGVQHLSGHGEAVLVDGAVYDLAQLLLAAGEGHLIVADVGGIGPVHKAQVLRDVLVEDDTAGGGLYHSGVLTPSTVMVRRTPMGQWGPITWSL